MKHLKGMVKNKVGKTILILVGILLVYFLAAAIKKEQVTQLITAKIKANPDWYNNVKGAAKNAGISVESQMKIEIQKLFKTSNDFIGQWWNF